MSKEREWTRAKARAEAAGWKVEEKKRDWSNIVQYSLEKDDMEVGFSLRGSGILRFKVAGEEVNAPEPIRKLWRAGMTREAVLDTIAGDPELRKRLVDELFDGAVSRRDRAKDQLDNEQRRYERLMQKFRRGAFVCAEEDCWKPARAPSAYCERHEP